MNKKVIDSKVLVIDSDGVGYLMGRVNESRLHVKYLLDFIHYKYPNTPSISLTQGNARDRLIYQLCQCGNVVYTNDVNFGMFYFPNELTDKQIDTLYALDLENQKVAICYNLKEIGNNINFRTIGLDNNYNLKGAVLEYLNRFKTYGRRK